MKNAAALYGLHIDAFLEGIATEVPKPETFGLNDNQAKQVRRERYRQRIEDLRSKKTRAA